jgi:C1A family cysteine protease
MPAPKRQTTRRRTTTRRPKRILNCKPSPKVELDWTFEHAAQADIVAAAPAIPPTKDLRAAWWKINDQEATGSCVGWATADGLLRWHFVSAGRVQRNELLSPRFIWMASKETDQYITQPTTFIETEGTSLKSALDVARKFGAVRDTALPFKDGTLYQGDTQSFYALASQLKILSYFNVGTNLTNWKTWLATKGPILTRLDVDATWDAATDNAGNMDEYKPNTTRGGHAVAIVGYKSDRFIVRNSWGTGWGDKGFGYASLAYAQEAFTEAYGIAV